MRAGPHGKYASRKPTMAQVYRQPERFSDASADLQRRNDNNGTLEGRLSHPRPLMAILSTLSIRIAIQFRPCMCLSMKMRSARYLRRTEAARAQR